MTSIKSGAGDPVGTANAGSATVNATPRASGTGTGITTQNAAGAIDRRSVGL
jgi:hypothetical protein